MRKTTLHAWIAILFCIAAMASHADRDPAPAARTASGHYGG